MKHDSHQQPGSPRKLKRPTLGLIGFGVLLVIALFGWMRAGDQRHLEAAQAAVRVEDYHTAVKQYETVQLIPLGKDDLRSLSLAYRQVGKTEKATLIDERLARKYRTDPDILVRQANLAIAEGRTTDAERLYNQLIEQHPKTASGYLGRARLAYAKGDTAQAYQLLTQPNLPAAGQIELLLELATLSARAGETERARQAYEAVLQLEPANDAALVGTGRAQLQPFPTEVIKAAGGSQ